MIHFINIILFCTLASELEYMSNAFGHYAMTTGILKLEDGLVKL